jgi:hypothetical protein
MGDRPPTSAAEGLDKQDRRRHPPATDLDRVISLVSAMLWAVITLR